MVELLSLAHERACEAELAGVLESLLAAPKFMPDMATLRARFAPDPADLPDVVVDLVPLSAYEALLSPARGKWHDPGHRCHQAHAHAE